MELGKGLERESGEEKLRNLGMLTLEEWRLRGDLKPLFNSLTGGCSQAQAANDMRKKSITVRVVKPWHKFSGEAVDGQSLEVLKSGEEKRREEKRRERREEEKRREEKRREEKRREEKRREEKRREEREKRREEKRREEKRERREKRDLINPYTLINYRKVSFYSKNVVYIQSPEDWDMTFPIA
ncbi:hypothetical protein DUI87_06914 [Hirundo rustica rustica]|uniref:Uncharacterized protein n=1 Tax=Hirundo rustica rustica TaxID=333673 RepID=A0A3M0KVD2_HIRRU|nr:hypothetical protein DUI87_06914 [Hirundo rustica rustica]